MLVRIITVAMFLHCVSANLSLSKLGLEQVPDYNHTATTTKVDLSRNRITEIGRQNFSGQAALAELNLGFNRISYIEPGAFEGTNLEKLSLNNNHLTTAPPVKNLTNLYHLNLGSNRITNISIDAFVNTSMRLLLLGYNQLTAVPYLAYLPLLYNLDLQGNLMKDIEQENLVGTRLGLLNLKDVPIEGCPNMTMLSLEMLTMNQANCSWYDVIGETGITNLSMSFRNTSFNIDNFGRAFPNLTYLRVNFSDLDTIPDDLSPSLEYIAILESKFVNLTDPPLPYLPKLLSLSFAKNSISKISEDYFANVSKVIDYISFTTNKLKCIPNFDPWPPSLRHILFDYNSITNCSSDSKINMTGVEILQLPYNKLLLVPNITAPNLTHADLTYNEITEILPFTFVRWPSMESLNLYSNQIELVTQDSFSGLNFLVYLNLGQNRLTCFPNLAVLSDSLVTFYMKGNRLSQCVNSSNLTSYNEPLSALRALSISGNDLVTIPPFVTIHTNLTTLHMNYNYRMTMVPDIQDSNPKLERLYIKDMYNIECTCNQTWIKQANFNVYYLSNIRCPAIGKTFATAPIAEICYVPTPPPTTTTPIRDVLQLPEVPDHGFPDYCDLNWEKWREYQPNPEVECKGGSSCLSLTPSTPGGAGGTVLWEGVLTSPGACVRSCMWHACGSLYLHWGNMTCVLHAGDEPGWISSDEEWKFMIIAK